MDKIVSLYHNLSALPELLGPILDTLRAIRPQSKPHAMPVALQQRHLAVLEKALGASENTRKLRQPLQWRKSITTSIETKMPRFQLDYTFKKDIDPDQDRVKVKQLTRQLKREKKAAMRELRRDSDFIDAERYKERLSEGQLLAPVQDNADYYFRQALALDADNAQAADGQVALRHAVNLVIRTTQGRHDQRAAAEVNAEVQADRQEQEEHEQRIGRRERVAEPPEADDLERRIVGNDAD